MGSGDVDARRRRQVSRSSRHKMWLDAERQGPCMDCGLVDARVMEFHHRDPSQKSFSLSDPGASGKSLADKEREKAKCDRLCANCHLIRHWEIDHG